MKIKNQVFWARLASFGQLGLVSGPRTNFLCILRMVQDIVLLSKAKCENRIPLNVLLRDMRDSADFHSPSWIDSVELHFC